MSVNLHKIPTGQSPRLVKETLSDWGREEERQEGRGERRDEWRKNHGGRGEGRGERGDEWRENHGGRGEGGKEREELRKLMQIERGKETGRSGSTDERRCRHGWAYVVHGKLSVTYPLTSLPYRLPLLHYPLLSLT